MTTTIELRKYRMRAGKLSPAKIASLLYKLNRLYKNNLVMQREASVAHLESVIRDIEDSRNKQMYELNLQYRRGHKPTMPAWVKINPDHAKQAYPNYAACIS